MGRRPEASIDSMPPASWLRAIDFFIAIWSDHGRATVYK